MIQSRLASPAACYKSLLGPSGPKCLSPKTEVSKVVSHVRGVSGALRAQTLEFSPECQRGPGRSEDILGIHFGVPSDGLHSQDIREIRGPNAFKIRLKCTCHELALSVTRQTCTWNCPGWARKALETPHGTLSQTPPFMLVYAQGTLQARRARETPAAGRRGSQIHAQSQARGSSALQSPKG